jgi:hypothetical protein
MQQLGVHSAAELLQQQAEFTTVQCFFSLDTPPSEGKGSKYVTIQNPFQGVENGIPAIDWSGKINTPYASGTLRRCVKEGVVFWLATTQTGQYSPGLYYRMARKGESKATVKSGLTKKPQ